MLCTSLAERGLDGWLYACGKRENLHETHAWAEREGLVADITADQFPQHGTVYVGPRTSWFDTWEPSYDPPKVDRVAPDDDYMEGPAYGRSSGTCPSHSPHPSPSLIQLNEAARAEKTRVMAASQRYMSARRSYTRTGPSHSHQGKGGAGSVSRRQGKIECVIRNPHDDAELLALVRRYVTPERRYLKLGGGLLRMENPACGRFMRDLREDAGLITADEIAKLLEGGWRERRTAAWLVAVSRRTEFRERLGALLLASEVCCVGLAYSVALASFGTARDADLLAAYLDRYLCRPDLAYDQTVVMGALQFIDLNLGGGQADRFREPGGLWQQWLQDAPHMQGDSDPAPSNLSLIRRLCAFVDEYAEAR